MKTLITIVEPTTLCFNTNESLNQGQRLLISLVSLSWVELTTKLWGQCFYYCHSQVYGNKLLHFTFSMDKIYLNIMKCKPISSSHSCANVT